MQSATRSNTDGREDDKHQIVHLNVGGTWFTTFRSTLCRVKGSLFELLLSSFVVSVDRDPNQPTQLQHQNRTLLIDDAGCIVIDRDPRLFRHILHYLRNDSLPNIAQIDDARGFEHELNYFMLNAALFEFKVLTSRFIGLKMGSHEGDLLSRVKQTVPNTFQIFCNHTDSVKMSMYETNFSNTIDYTLLNHEVILKDVCFDLNLEGDFEREDPTVVLEAQSPTSGNEWTCITTLVTNYRYQYVKGIFNIDCSHQQFYHRFRITVKYKVNRVNIANLKFFGFLREKA